MNYPDRPHPKVFISAYICNTLEVYDFIISGMLIPYISHLYFPLENKISILLAGSLSFLVGFIMRPIGAIFFGYIGDTYGRKKALLMSIFGMAIATLFIGILPTYATLGLLAPCLLVFLRACQGFCVGGESQGAIVFVLEHFKGDRPGLRGSLLATSNGAAALLSFFIGMLVMSPQVPEWGWRLCYVFGSFLGIIGLYLRTRITDTPAFLEFQNQKSRRKRIPISTILHQRKLNMLAIVLYVGVVGALTYTGFTFINLFLHKFLGFSSQAALGFSIFQTFLAMCCVIIGGFACDKIGIDKIIKYMCFFIIISIFPAHYLLATGEFFYILLACFLLALATGTAGILPHFAASLFPTSERYSGVAFSANVGHLIAGIQPTLAIYLIKETDILWSPAFYTFFISFIFFLFICFFGSKLERFYYIQERSTE